jgi:hypothetical protein
MLASVTARYLGARFPRDGGRSFRSGEVRVSARKGGVRIDDPKQLFCIRPAMEALGDEQPSLVLVVRTSTVV